MRRARTTLRRAGRHDDVVAVGAPVLAVSDEDREQLEDQVAELLVVALEREQPPP